MDRESIFFSALDATANNNSENDNGVLLFSGHTPLYLASFQGHAYVLLSFLLRSW